MNKKMFFKNLLIGFSGSTRLYPYPYPIFITLPGRPLPYAGDPTSGRTYIGSPRGGGSTRPAEG